MKFHIQNMTCGGCVRHVTKAIQSVDAAAVVKADLRQRVAEVQSTAAETDVAKALEEAGYPAVRI